MFGFFKHRRRTTGAEPAEDDRERVAAALVRWRSTTLEPQRDLLERQFAEHLAEIPPAALANARKSFEAAAEDEALAAMDQWIAGGADRAEAFFTQYLGQGAPLHVKDAGAGGELVQQVERELLAATVALNAGLSRLIEEALLRRGEPPQRRS